MVVTAKSIDDENPELTSKELTQYVQTLDMEPENTSDHVPVIATIKRKLVRKSNKPKSVILTAAKRQLRKAHRQAYASQREKLANQIMIASPSDNKLFHKLLRTQRSDENRFTKTLRRDIDGISAEHYKNAEAELLSLILHILNTVIEQLDIPQILKGGIMTPVLKKNKDRQNPAHYRGITVTKIFTKILQSVLKSRKDIKIHQIQNQLQRGFTEAIPMIFAAFLASEVTIQSCEDDREILLLTLDAEKAFDKLEHEILFNRNVNFIYLGFEQPMTQGHSGN
ncbi:unnamed protein product [Mytilus coruscus]|uniref:Reverse transcriptase domain-containing protein n=1 Tax=Mytilus coruscus TaxID=42192 RepID=A0A6J8BW58_MYTCO|nr:unnamed protein product [Mytilus coruscus]